MTACNSGGWDPTGSAGATTTTLGTAVTQPPIQAQLTSYSLQPFDACDDFLDYVKEHAVDLVGPWGFGYDGGWLAADGRLMMDEAAADTATAPSVAGGDNATVDFSGTNVQELGVDEPDIVKTDGSLVVAVANNTLYTIDVSGDTARLAGSFDLGDNWAQDILLAGDKVLVMATSSGYGVRGGAGYPAEHPARCSPRSTSATPPTWKRCAPSPSTGAT